MPPDGAGPAARGGFAWPGAHSAPANERRGALGPHERVSRGVGQSPT